MSRRTILASVAAVAAAGLGGMEAKASALPGNDARLLRLDAARARAVEWHSLCCLDEDRDFPTEEAHAVAIAARDSASDAWDSIVRQMAETPAEGLTGVAVKAAQACRAVQDGASAADLALVASLRADLARLVPEVEA